MVTVEKEGFFLAPPLLSGGNTADTCSASDCRVASLPRSAASLGTIRFALEGVPPLVLSRGEGVVVVVYEDEEVFGVEGETNGRVAADLALPEEGLPTKPLPSNIFR